MNILLFSAQFGNPYQGGHISSMLTIGNELIKNKIRVTIGLPATLKQSDKWREIYHLFPKKNIVWLPKSNIFYDKILLTKHISSIIKKQNIKIIHSFDLDSHIVARLCAHNLNYKIKVVGNICGMTLKYKYPYASPVIVFSQELKDQMKNIFNNYIYDIFLEPARMNLSYYLNVIKNGSNLAELHTIDGYNIKERAWPKKW